MPTEPEHPSKRRFTVIFEKEDEGGYHVFCPTLPGCHTQSETVEEGIAYFAPACVKRWLLKAEC